MDINDRNLLLRALSERIPYQTAIETLDSSPGGILKCTDWEGHVWITGRNEPYDVSEVRPILRKYQDLTSSEVVKIFSKIIGPTESGPGPDQWHITDEGEPYCEDESYSLFFAPNIIDDFLDSLRASWVDTQKLIDRGLAFRVDYYNNPYLIKNLPKRRTDRISKSSSNWMVLPLKK